MYQTSLFLHICASQVEHKTFYWIGQIFRFCLDRQRSPDNTAYDTTIEEAAGALKLLSKI